MENSGTSARQSAPVKKSDTGFEKFKAVIAKINYTINLIGTWLYRLRKPVMAAPVAYYALKIAQYNMAHLPEEVGINLQSTGEFAQTISRQMAVMGPLGLTAACLLLMFCSRKASYSWAISVFTLALPLVLLFTNVYPA